MSVEDGAEAPSPFPEHPSERLIRHVALACALTGGAILIALALTVTVSVLGRWIVGREVAGAYEIVQVGIAVAAFLFLPICQLRNRNIVVDAFTAQAPRRLQRLLDAIWAAAYAAVALALAWLLALGASETIRSGTVTTMIRLPFGWAMVVGVGALLFLALVAALVAWRHGREAAR